MFHNINFTSNILIFWTQANWERSDFEYFHFKSHVNLINVIGMYQFYSGYLQSGAVWIWIFQRIKAWAWLTGFQCCLLLVATLHVCFIALHGLSLQLQQELPHFFPLLFLSHCCPYLPLLANTSYKQHSIEGFWCEIIMSY